MVYFFVGTVAEFIKVFPVLKRMEDCNISYSILASGQNDLSKSELKYFLRNFSPVYFSKVPKKQSVISLMVWFVYSLITGVIKLRRVFKKGDIVVVHGDTLSSLLGAIIAKVFGLKLVHLEAGLRSYNFFRPFPEEICRVLTSFLADVALCPNQWAMNNLKRKGLIKINTYNNTLYESCKFALTQNPDSDIISKLPPKPYFIFITHRQENIYNKKTITQLVSLALEFANHMNCVFVIHSSTREVLKKHKLLDQIESTRNVYVFERIPYITFTHALKNSEFIITDGGSNQEESYYLGKPCLILRKETERIEGLGKNVVLSKLDLQIIREFITNYKNYSYPPIDDEISPSEIIVNFLRKLENLT